MTTFSKLEREQIISIVLRCMIFRFTNDEIIDEIKRQSSDKVTISKASLSRLKREIKTRNMDLYSNMKMTQDLFLSKIMEKYQNIDIYIREYFKIYNNKKINDITKLRILEKIAELDQIQLRMQQDLPYLEIYHNDARDELESLAADIRGLKEKLTEDQIPHIHNDPLIRNRDSKKIPIESITKDKEMQDILTSRTQSGFEGRILKK